MPQEPYHILVEATPPEGYDLNEHHEALAKAVHASITSLGHTVQKVSITHGSLRGGSKTHTGLAASDVAPTPTQEAVPQPTDGLVATVVPAP